MKKKPSQKKSYVPHLIIALFVIAIVWSLLVLKGNQQYTFQEGFEKLQEIDKKYGASFKGEQVNLTEASIPSEENIPLLLGEIKQFEQTIKPSPSDEGRALLLFTDARKLMLTAEWYWYQGHKLGDKGLVLDEMGFTCNEAQEIIDAAFYFNETFNYARQAQAELDALLVNYPQIPGVLDLVGTNKNKTNFYKSGLKPVRHVPINNVYYLEKLCGIKAELRSTLSQVDQEKLKGIEALYKPQQQATE